MKPSELLRALDALLDVAPPMFMHGPPGICKTALVNQLVARRKIQLLDIRAILYEPTEFRGVPFVVNNEFTKQAIPLWLPRDGEGLIFLDELPQAMPAMQMTLGQLLHEGRIGEYVLPKGWRVMAAGNRPKDRAGANKLLTHLASRCLNLDLEVDHEDWQTWALAAGIHPVVRSFLRFKPSMLMTFDPESSAREFACPRTWEFTSDVYDSTPEDLRLPVISGLVSRGVAAEFLAHAALYGQLPSVDAILADPSGHEVPREPSVLYALCGALTEALRRPKIDLGAFCTFAARLPKEFGVLAFRDAAQVNGKVLSSPAAQAWLKQNRVLLTAAAK